MRKRLLALLNIRSDEAWLVGNLFWFQFFQGVGVAMFNTVAFALFLEQFQITELPKVYLFSALLLLATGWVYSKVEHALHIKKLVPLVIVAIAGSLLLYRLRFVFGSGYSTIFLMFSWYYVIYLLNNLEFWGVAALLFDIRQSKRLFGMIGAGDIPAKLIGYSAVPVLIKLTGSHNLLIISSVSILASLIFYNRLRKAGKLDIHVQHEHHHAHHGHHHTPTVRELVKGFFGNRMIAMVAGLSFIVVTCVTVINFAFYSEIKGQAHSNEQLAGFLGMFLAGGRMLAIVIRLIFTGRITNIIGTKGSLLISPVILFLFLVVIIFLPFMLKGHLAVLYMFGVMAVVTEVLKTSLQDPVFLSLMQPLSSGLRLKGHTVVKGVMDPFALAFSGLLLYALMGVKGGVDLQLLSYVLLALLIVWVVVIFLVDTEYVKTLVTALHRRYSVGQEIDLASETTWRLLHDKAATGERGEVIYILNLLSKQYQPDMEPIVLRALQHPSPQVKMEALKLVQQQKAGSAITAIEQIIDARPNPEVLAEAVKAKCMLQAGEMENIEEILNVPDERMVKAAITGFISSGGINAVVTAGQKLLNLIDSPEAVERRLAAEIIGELRITTFYKPLLKLMGDADEVVVIAAINAAGKVGNAKLLPAISEYFLQNHYMRYAADALVESGNHALPFIQQALTEGRLTRKQQARLIAVAGRIGTPEALNLLNDMLWQIPHYRRDVLHNLQLGGFIATAQQKEKHLELIKDYVQAAVRILFMIRELPQNKTTNILADALHIELDEIRDSVFILFSFVYDREKMIKARNAFHQRKKESIANALEVVEIAVPKDISLKFNAAFEPGTVADRCRALQAHLKITFTYEKVMEEILKSVHYPYNRWTKATALHSLIFYKGPMKEVWLTNVQNENDILLTQTAQKILAEMN